MKGEDILALFERFEQAATKVNDIECWSARSLCPLFGYTDWRNFIKAIDKAQESCINAGEAVSDAPYRWYCCIARCDDGAAKMVFRNRGAIKELRC